MGFHVISYIPPKKNMGRVWPSNAARRRTICPARWSRRASTFQSPRCESPGVPGNRQRKTFFCHTWNMLKSFSFSRHDNDRPKRLGQGTASRKAEPCTNTISIQFEYASYTKVILCHLYTVYIYNYIYRHILKLNVKWYKSIQIRTNHTIIHIASFKG